LIPFIGKKSHHPQRQHFSAPTTTATPARITLFNAQTTTLVATAQSCIHLKERKNLQKKRRPMNFCVGLRQRMNEPAVAATRWGGGHINQRLWKKESRQTQEPRHDPRHHT